jgi:phage tail-like protein
MPAPAEKSFLTVLPKPPRKIDNDPSWAGNFFVKVEELAIGTFTTCEGLTAEYTFEDITEGGNNQFLYRLPGRIKYGNVKLTRPVNKDSAAIIKWFTHFQTKQTMRSTAQIEMHGVDSKIPLFVWTLMEVHPIRWTGPTFAADSNGLAKETLELAFHGFKWEEKK